MQVDSYASAGVLASVGLVNELALGHSRGRPVSVVEALPALGRILAVDPPSLARLSEEDVPGFMALARRVREVFESLRDGDVDTASSRLNELLASHPAHPHLAKEHGIWRLHHHPVDAALVPMWTAICAEGVARMIGVGFDNRLGTCAGADCERVFLDVSKNASRRFCSTTCQNRIKTAAFRRRRLRDRSG